MDNSSENLIKNVLEILGESNAYFCIGDSLSPYNLMSSDQIDDL